MTTGQFLIFVGSAHGARMGDVRGFIAFSRRPIPADGRADRFVRRCVLRGARLGNPRHHRYRPARAGPMAGRVAVPSGSLIFWIAGSLIVGSAAARIASSLPAT